MAESLLNSLSTLLVFAGVFALLLFIVIKMIRDKKKRKGSCAGGCAGCPHSSGCDYN